MAMTLRRSIPASESVNMISAMHIEIQRCGKYANRTKTNDSRVGRQVNGRIVFRCPCCCRACMGEAAHAFVYRKYPFRVLTSTTDVCSLPHGMLVYANWYSRA
jgi:hypothetical protein